MKTEQVISELRKLPIPPKLREELNEPGNWDYMAESLNGMSNIERSNMFNITRLSFYMSFVEELGFLPSEFIMEVVGACAVSIRTMSQLDDDNWLIGSHYYTLLSDIRKIGEGIASAKKMDTTIKYGKLDRIKFYEMKIRTYSSHGFVQGLSNDATAGDCFLFNIMVYATGRAPFKNIDVTTVVEHYFEGFSRIKEVESKNNQSASTLSMALDSAVRDIFGKYDPLMPRVSEAHIMTRVSEAPKNERGNIVKYIIILCILIWGLIYNISNYS